MGRRKGKKKEGKKKKEEKGLTLYSSSKQFASIPQHTHTHTHPSIANFHSFLPSMS
jgi:hypothetical protein